MLTAWLALGVLGGRPAEAAAAPPVAVGSSAVALRPQRRRVRVGIPPVWLDAALAPAGLTGGRAEMTRPKAGPRMATVAAGLRGGRAEVGAPGIGVALTGPDWAEYDNAVWLAAAWATAA